MKSRAVSSQRPPGGVPRRRLNGTKIMKNLLWKRYRVLQEVVFLRDLCYLYGCKKNRLSAIPGYADSY